VITLRKHVRAHAVGYVALMVALVGVPTAWAVAKNSIGSKQIKPAAVKASDLHNNAVTSPKVADGSLQAADFAAGQLPAGPPGEPGQPFRAMALVDGDDPPEILPDVAEVGFDSVSRAEAGVFCLVPTAGVVDPAVDPPFVTVEYNYSAGQNFTVMWDSGTGVCNDGTYEIKTYQAETGSPVDNVAFVIMVP
jgi:hypothetical protein